MNETLKFTEEILSMFKASDLFFVSSISGTRDGIFPLKFIKISGFIIFLINLFPGLPSYVLNFTTNPIPPS